MMTENNNENSVETEKNSVVENSPETNECRTCEEKPFWRLIFPGLLAGLVGGGLMFGLVTYFPTTNGITGDESGTKMPIESEAVAEVDRLMVSLVENRSPGVVSIIISKEVVQTPNAGRWPFFFPFNQQQPEAQEEGAPAEKRQVGSGSGFFVSEDGMIATNKHVVSDEKATYTIRTTAGQEYEAKVLGRDPNNDIAILKIEGAGFPALPLGDSDAIRVGQTAIAIGNPLGEFANSVSRGIISGMQRDVTAGSGYGQEERLTNILQTDAAINPGNSGGPLFDIKGEVIGMNVAVAQGAENIGFALPVNDVKRIVDQVRETGRIVTPYLGVRYALINEKSAKELGLPYNYGALILRGQDITDVAVIPGSPADRAGLVENDIILEINGEKITEENTLGDTIAQSNVGDEISLLVSSKGETKEIKVILEERK